MEPQFWVVGGEYKSTRFREPAHGDHEQWFGPFGNYETAKAEWSKRAWQTVDEATTRFRIERIDPDQPPPCTD